MNSKKDTQEKIAALKAPVKRRPAPGHTAMEKAQAVLAIWTERVQVKAIIYTLGVSYHMLQQWQERALEGMLQALEPGVNLADGAVLSPRLQALLQRRQLAAGSQKLQARLEKLAGVAPQGEPPSNA